MRLGLQALVQEVSAVRERFSMGEAAIHTTLHWASSTTLSQFIRLALRKWTTGQVSVECWKKSTHQPLLTFWCVPCLPVNPKGNQSWKFIGRTDAEAETPTFWPPGVKNWLIWKRPWCWERLKARGEGDDRAWNAWMASLMWWTWVWVGSGSWWWGRKESDTTEMT